MTTFSIRLFPVCHLRIGTRRRPIASTSLVAGQTTSWIQDCHLVYQVLSSKVPGYLADNIHLASESSARSLRSSLERKCSVTRVHSRFGDMFCCSGPLIWNNLPASLRNKEVSCTELRKQLKTFMFQTCRLRCIVTFLIIALYIYSYLLTYSNHNCKKSPFSRTAAHIFVSPEDAPAIITQYVAWMERQFNAC